MTKGVEGVFSDTVIRCASLSLADHNPTLRQMVASPHELRWILPEPADPVLATAFSTQLGIAPFAAELLCRRGIRSLEEAQRFLFPKLKTLTDPFLLPNMSAAVERILAAVDARERIVLYGDYDVDGVTSLALLTRVLRALGNEARCFLPLRAGEGYGLSAEGVARCLQTMQPRLLIAVDCGTASCAEVAGLCRQGVEVIVLDHHECQDTLPECVALVNPKLCEEFRYLCSAGLAFKLAHALLKRRQVEGFDLRECLDLVALGTVADLVPMREENRTFVKRGLEQLARTRWAGLRALIEVSGLSAPFTPGDLGFGLGPRLNAAGRLGTAQDALELLLTDDPVRARELATALDAQNRDRRAVEDEVFELAETQLGEWFQAGRDAAIVVGADGWHPGVIGIVAARLQRRYHRPALVIGFDEEGLGKGSGRSIEGLSLVAALGCCGELLVKHGGHEMAAGLTLQRARFEEFREAFRRCAREVLSDAQLQPRLRIDAELTFSQLNYTVLEQLDSLQPFGLDNPQPVFFARGVGVADEPRILKEKHLSFLLQQGREQRRAMFFGAAEMELPPPPWEVAFQIERNEWQGRVSVDLHLRAIRAG